MKNVTAFVKKICGLLLALCCVTDHLFAQFPAPSVLVFFKTNSYVEFLNNVATTDYHDLYHATDEIMRSGKPGSYHYEFYAQTKKSFITFVNRFDVARYHNWWVSIYSNTPANSSFFEEATEDESDNIFVPLNAPIDSVDPALKSNDLLYSCNLLAEEEDLKNLDNNSKELAWVDWASDATLLFCLLAGTRYYTTWSNSIDWDAVEMASRQRQAQRLRPINEGDSNAPQAVSRTSQITDSDRGFFKDLQTNFLNQLTASSQRISTSQQTLSSASTPYLCDVPERSILEPGHSIPTSIYIDQNNDFLAISSPSYSPKPFKLALRDLYEKQCNAQQEPEKLDSFTEVEKQKELFKTTLQQAQKTMAQHLWKRCFHQASTLVEYYERMSSFRKEGGTFPESLESSFSSQPPEAVSESHLGQCQSDQLFHAFCDDVKQWSDIASYCKACTELFFFRDEALLNDIQCYSDEDVEKTHKIYQQALEALSKAEELYSKHLPYLEKFCCSGFSFSTLKTYLELKKNALKLNPIQKYEKLKDGYAELNKKHLNELMVFCSLERALEKQVDRHSFNKPLQDELQFECELSSHHTSAEKSDDGSLPLQSEQFDLDQHLNDFFKLLEQHANYFKERGFVFHSPLGVRI